MRNVYFDIPLQDVQTCIALEQVASAIRKGREVRIVYLAGTRETHIFASEADAKKVFEGIKSEIQRP